MGKIIRNLDGYMVYNEKKTKFLCWGAVNRYGNSPTVFCDDWNRVLVYDSKEDAEDEINHYFDSHKKAPYFIERIKASIILDIKDD